MQTRTASSTSGECPPREFRSVATLFTLIDRRVIEVQASKDTRCSQQEPRGCSRQEPKGARCRVQGARCTVHGARCTEAPLHLAAQPAAPRAEGALAPRGAAACTSRTSLPVIRDSFSQ